MNAFDIVVIALAVVIIVMGFTSGLLRSLATILAYLIAAPAALELTSRVTALALGPTAIAPDKTWLVLLVVFAALGVMLGALFRVALSEFIGPTPGCPTAWVAPRSARCVSFLSR